MEKLFGIITLVLFFSFFLFIIVSTIRYFRIMYQKTADIGNRAVRIFLALIFAAFYGFVALHGAVMEDPK